MTTAPAIAALLFVAGLCSFALGFSLAGAFCGLCGCLWVVSVWEKF